MIRAFLIFLAFLNILCADSMLKDYNLDGIITLAAFGDSLTEGVISRGVKSIGYPFYLTKLLNLTVYKRGFSGAITSEIVEKLVEIKNLQPDIVVWLSGANDVWIGYPAQRLANYFQMAANYAFSKNTQILFVTIPVPPCCGDSPLIKRKKDYNEMIRNLAKKNFTRVVDLEHIIAKMCKSSCPLFSNDQVHLTDLGYKVFAEAVACELLGIDPLKKGAKKKLAEATGFRLEDLYIGDEF